MNQEQHTPHSSSKDLSILKELSLSELHERISQLEYLSQNFDPFGSKDDFNDVLKVFSLETLEDPFALTNQIIFLLENALEELQKRGRI